MPKQAEDQKKKAKRYFTLSLGFHVGIFAFFSLAQLISPSKAIVINPSVQIDMVALPNQVKQETPPALDPTAKIKEDVPPPPEEKPQPDEPEPAPIKEVAKAPPKDSSKDAEKALERLRAQMKKNDKKKEAESRKEQQEQLTKKEKDLKRFEEAYRNALSGNQVHKGTNSTGDMTEALNAYGGHITERLRSNWGLPAYLQGKGLRAIVIIYIDPSGKMARFFLKQGSGNQAFDDYVTATVKATNYAPPPEDLANGLRRTGVEVTFPL